MSNHSSYAAVLGFLMIASAFADPDLSEKHLYNELGCKPSGTGDQLTYDCSHLKTRDNSKCYFRGAEFVPDPQNTGESIPGSCLASCSCSTPEPGHKQTTVSTLRCANIECPTLFNPRLIPQGCQPTYDSDKGTCCNTGIICDPTTPDQSTTSRVYERKNYSESTFRCRYKGETYLEDTKFYPEDAPCSVCYCRKGFDGTLKEPYCRDIVCGYELHYAQNVNDGCAPVNLEKRPCCPIAWRCPEKTDRIIPSTKSSAETSGTCKWGSLTLKRGDTLSPPASETCMKCTCKVPPMVTCEKPPSC